MDLKTKRLRIELDELGYYQYFTTESVPLIEKLIADLKTTTESLQKYMKIAQNAIEERDNLQTGAEPYKCDNARLVKECNDLHLSFMKYREQNDKIQTDLKRRLDALKSDNHEYQSENEILKNRIKQLEIELVNRGEILLSKKPSLKSSSTGALSARKTKSFEIDSAMALADQKLANLTKDVKKLKEHNLQLIEANELLQCQLNNRDKEVKRLGSLLEGGRPLQAIKKDCCCSKDSHEEINVIQEQINKMMQEKHILENRLKDAIAKQHEAMKRALHLAERNKMLEKEMKDIDHLALAVEAECNNTVKTNTEKVNRLQDRMHESVLQIQTLERENIQLKQDKRDLIAELDAIKVEKRHLQTVLETSLEEKKRSTDRINNFTIIEHDLNMEIDRLNRISAEQKRKIAELECQLVSEKVDNGHSVQKETDESQKTQKRVINRVTSPDISKAKAKKRTNLKKSAKNGESEAVAATLQVPTNTPHIASPGAESGKCTCCCDGCQGSKHLKELLDKELEYREQQAQNCIENLRSEKEYYMKEYHRILEQMKNLPSISSSSNKNDKNSDLLQKLAEKEQTVAQLEQEIRTLSKEKFNLLSRLDSARNMAESNADGPCLKAACKRIERERDILRSDLERSEEERDALKFKLKNISDNQIGESERLQRRLLEAEEQIHKLEQERRELVQSQSSRRATVDGLQEQCDGLRDQLRVAQSELNQQKAMYNQLKTLHEQTDHSLSDTQNKLIQAEMELADALDNLKKRDRDRGVVTKEVDMLKNDIEIMKTQLAQLDQEKDELLVALDDKTEKMAMMEHALRDKDKNITSLEISLNDFKKKLSVVIDENSSREHVMRTSETELASLRKELDTIKKIKDSAIQENRRLQDDLASVTCDCRDSRKELELYKRQVDDLKTQLQQYVAEVKRFEDLISNKEIERNELLDQFRSLSQEANILENNNHTLETEATQSRVQLSVALDHANDLERKLENKDSIIRSYEKQIGDLTSQIASLEIQLRQCMTQYDKCENELQNMRDLSVKLDNENGKFRRQLREREEHRVQLDRNVDQLRSERELLQQNIARDRRNVETVEKDLDGAKHETTELRLLNQDLQDEVQKMKTEIQDLKDKLFACPCVHTADPSSSNTADLINRNVSSHLKGEKLQNSDDNRSKTSSTRESADSSAKLDKLSSHVTMEMLRLQNNSKSLPASDCGPNYVADKGNDFDRAVTISSSNVMMDSLRIPQSREHKRTILPARAQPEAKQDTSSFTGAYKKSTFDRKNNVSGKKGSQGDRLSSEDVDDIDDANKISLEDNWHAQTKAFKRTSLSENYVMKILPVGKNRKCDVQKKQISSVQTDAEVVEQDSNNLSNVPYLDVRKIALESRRLPQLPELVSEESGSDEIVNDGPVLRSVNDGDKCPVKCYITNYTVVKETHKTESPKKYSKK